MKIYISCFVVLCAGFAGPVLADTPPRHDPFKRPASLRLEQALTERSVATLAATPPQVQATLVGGAAPLALIGGSVVAIGDVTGGYKLVAVREGVAVFERDGEITEIAVRRDDQTKEHEKDDGNAQ